MPSMERADVERLAARIDVDAIAARLDVEAVLDRLDLTAIAADVIEQLDLPQLIRDATADTTSESVRSVRIRGVGADRAVRRAVDRVLRRAGDGAGGRSSVTTRRLNVDAVPVEARGFQGHPAGLVTRSVANVIDVAVVVLLLPAAYLGVAGFLFLRQGARFSFPIVSYRTAYAAGFVALVVYFAISWTAGGRTYGDRVLGLRVQTSAGADVGVAGRRCGRSCARCSRCSWSGPRSIDATGRCRTSSCGHARDLRLGNAPDRPKAQTMRPGWL